MPSTGQATDRRQLICGASCCTQRGLGSVHSRERSPASDRPCDTAIDMGEEAAMGAQSTMSLLTQPKRPQALRLVAMAGLEAEAPKFKRLGIADHGSQRGLA